MLGELTGERQAHGRLDLLVWCVMWDVRREMAGGGTHTLPLGQPCMHARMPAYLAGGERGLLGVAGELAGLGGEAVEDVVDEGVQDRHAALGDPGVGVHLLEHLVDVRAVALHARLLLGALCCG